MSLFDKQKSKYKGGFCALDCDCAQTQSRGLYVWGTLIKRGFNEGKVTGPGLPCA
jgi:hypothetical protein